MEGILQLLIMLLFIPSIIKKLSSKLTPEKKTEIKKQQNKPIKHPQLQPSEPRPKSQQTKQKPPSPVHPDIGFSDPFVSLEDTAPVCRLSSDNPPSFFQTDEKSMLDRWNIKEPDLVQAVIMSEILGKPKALRR